VICALNGVAAGAGMSVVLACDVIIAAKSASLIQSFVNVGLVPDCGSTWFLARSIGYHAAFEICATGRKIEMAEAKTLGLVGEVVESDELMTRAKIVAEQYSQMPTKAIGLMKRALNKTFTNDLEATLDYEAYMQEIAGISEDYKEGVAAFNEKRKPNFKGR
jgi:2-(1,2-epoxy-1,2-dihydrophenyl)acetyl-CoA isomerase